MEHLTDADVAKLIKRVAAGSSEIEDYRSLASHFTRVGRLEDSVQIYQNCLLLPLSVLARARVARDLGSLLFRQGKSAEARDLALDSLRRVAEQPETVELATARGLHEALIAHCMSADNIPGAQEAARRVCDSLESLVARHRNPEEIGLLYAELGDLYLLAEEPENAAVAAARALQHNLPSQDRVACSLTLAEGLRQLGRLADALGHLEAASAEIHSEPGLTPSLCLTRGLVLRGLRRPRDAREALMEAVRTGKDVPYLQQDCEFWKAVYGNLAELLYEAKEYHAAAETLINLLRQYPAGAVGRCRVITWLGDCYVFVDEHDRARQCFEMVLESPDASEDERSEARIAISRLPMLRSRWRRH